MQLSNTCESTAGEPSDADAFATVNVIVKCQLMHAGIKESDSDTH